MMADLLKDKILEGYAYRALPEASRYDHVNARTISVQTGRGGILILIDACRKEGLSDTYIENFIEVFVFGRWFHLSVLKIIKRTPESHVGDQN